MAAGTSAILIPMDRELGWGFQESGGAGLTEP
jgi:hypothetical protein